MATQLHLLT